MNCFCNDLFWKWYSYSGTCFAWLSVYNTHVWAHTVVWQCSMSRPPCIIFTCRHALRFGSVPRHVPSVYNTYMWAHAVVWQCSTSCPPLCLILTCGYALRFGSLPCCVPPCLIFMRGHALRFGSVPGRVPPVFDTHAWARIAVWQCSTLRPPGTRVGSCRTSCSRRYTRSPQGSCTCTVRQTTSGRSGSVPAPDTGRLQTV